MARTILEVFLSSTAADLKPHRNAVYARLTRIEFFKVIRQEDFGAQATETVKYCRDKARTSDLFIGLIGMRRGWEPTGDNAKRSITEVEYDSAKGAGQRQYIWVSSDDFPVPGNLRESDDEHQRQLGFRKRLMGEQIVSQKGFASPDALASEIVEQLLAHIVTGDLIKLLRPDLTQSQAAPIEDQKPAIAAAMEKLAQDKDVDLLALARSPQGIDIAELEAKLTARAELHEAKGQQQSKISAEYWRHIGALAFLHTSQKSLAAFEKATLLDPTNPEGWHELGKLQFRLGNLSAAKSSFETLLNLGQPTSDAPLRATGLIGLGIIYATRGDLDASEDIFREALKICENLGDKRGMASAYGNLGIIHRARADLDKAEEMHRKSLAIEEELGHKQGMADDYGNLGNIHFQRGDLDRAEEMHRKALLLDEELGRKEGMADDYGNLGNVQERRGDLRQAETMYLRALALDEDLGRKEGMARAYGNLGLVQLRHGHLDQAEAMLHRALALNEEVGRKEGIAIANWHLAVIHERRKNKSQLCACLTRARDLYRDIGLQGVVADAEEWMKTAGCPDSQPR